MVEARDAPGDPEPRLQVTASPSYQNLTQLNLLCLCQALNRLARHMLDLSPSITEWRNRTVRAQDKIVCFSQVCSRQG
jgi:hypothetical protein